MITGVRFKENMEYNGTKYSAGKSYKMEIHQVEVDRLMRRGCVYAEKDAKYSQVEKEIVKEEIKEEIKIEPEIVAEKIDDDQESRVEKNVINKNTKQAKIQAKSISKK